MTYLAYTSQQLAVLSLAELKAIAAQIGVAPLDKRSKGAHIEAILAKQPQAVAAPKSYEQLCYEVTRTRALHELKNWCAAHQMAQGEDFGVLYRSIFNYLVGFDYQKSRLGEHGCIDRAIRDRSELAEAICAELSIDIIDLSESLEDVVIPHGQDSYYAYYDGIKIATISTWNNSYISSKSNLAGCSDYYSAILETIDRGDVAIARAAVQRDRATALLMPDYI